MTTPSRAFLIQQSCLQVWPAYRWRTWHEFVTREAPLTYMSRYLTEAVRKEFRALAEKYGEANG